MNVVIPDGGLAGYWFNKKIL